MSFSEKAADAIRQSGGRMTAQRQQIIDLLENASQRLDAEALYDQARRNDPSISLATVYRTLAQRLSELCEQGTYGYLLDRDLQGEWGRIQELLGEGIPAGQGERSSCGCIPTGVVLTMSGVSKAVISGSASHVAADIEAGPRCGCRAATRAAACGRRRAKTVTRAPDRAKA